MEEKQNVAGIIEFDKDGKAHTNMEGEKEMNIPSEDQVALEISIPKKIYLSHDEFYLIRFSLDRNSVTPSLKDINCRLKRKNKCINRSPYLCLFCKKFKGINMSKTFKEV